MLKLQRREPSLSHPTDFRADIGLPQQFLVNCALETWSHPVLIPTLCFEDIMAAPKCPHCILCSYFHPLLQSLKPIYAEIIWWCIQVLKGNMVCHVFYSHLRKKSVHQRLVQVPSSWCSMFIPGSVNGIWAMWGDVTMLPLLPCLEMLSVRSLYKLHLVLQALFP